jgi:hypothetical protein
MKSSVGHTATGQTANGVPYVSGNDKAEMLSHLLIESMDAAELTEAQKEAFTDYFTNGMDLYKLILGQPFLSAE